MSIVSEKAIVKSCKNKSCSQANPQTIDNFKKRTKFRDGYNTMCRTCETAAYRIYREKNREKIRITQKNCYHRDKQLTKIRVRNKRLKQKYWPHLSAKEAGAEFDNLLNTQNNLCKMCGKPGTLVVDHDHKTGKIRGLLHNNCNTALGLLYEDVDTALALVKYIQEHKNVT